MITIEISPVKELSRLGLCILLVLGINFGAIIYYQTSFWELISQWPVTLCIGFCLYLLWCFSAAVKLFLSKSGKE